MENFAQWKANKDNVILGNVDDVLRRMRDMNVATPILEVLAVIGLFEQVIGAPLPFDVTVFLKTCRQQHVLNNSTAVDAYLQMYHCPVGEVVALQDGSATGNLLRSLVDVGLSSYTGSTPKIMLFFDIVLYCIRLAEKNRKQYKKPEPMASKRVVRRTKAEIAADDARGANRAEERAVAAAAAPPSRVNEETACESEVLNEVTKQDPEISKRVVELILQLAHVAGCRIRVWTFGGKPCRDALDAIEIAGDVNLIRRWNVCDPRISAALALHPECQLYGSDHIASVLHKAPQEYYCIVSPRLTECALTRENCAHLLNHPKRQ